MIGVRASGISIDDAALLRFKYRRRELAVRQVGLAVASLGLILGLFSLVRIAGLVAANWAVSRSGIALFGPWEGPRGRFHFEAAEQLVVTIPLAVLLGISGVGLGRFRRGSRDLTAATAVLLGMLSLGAIGYALTLTPIDDDWELETFPSPFFVGLLALGFGLPAFAALFGFVRSRLLDPLFTTEYRRAMAATPALPWPTTLVGFLTLALILGAMAVGADQVRLLAASAPTAWAIPEVRVEAAPVLTVQPQSEAATVE